MRLTRVEFEYNDGTIKFITGKELEKWEMFNAIVAQSAAIHGCNPPWESVEWSNQENYRLMTKNVNNDNSN